MQSFGARWHCHPTIKIALPDIGAIEAEIECNRHPQE